MVCTIDSPCPTPNITILPDLFTYSNTVTDGAFGVVLMFMTFIITAIAMKNKPTGQQIPAALFITLICGTILSLAGIIDQVLVYVLLAMTIAATVLLNR